MANINKKLFGQIEDFINKRVGERLTDDAEKYKELHQNIVETCMEVEARIDSCRESVAEFSDDKSFPIQAIQSDAMLLAYEQMKNLLMDSGLWKIYKDYDKD